MANSIFDHAVYTNTRARHIRGRVDLLSQDVANELNTYKNFGIFRTNNDVHSVSWDEKTYEDAPARAGKPDVAGTPGVRSIFNKLSAVLTATDEFNGFDNKTAKENIQRLVVKSSKWRLSNNVPLLDTPENRAALRQNSGCTVRELVKASQSGHFGTATYSYADFMYCKHLGRVPNNYLITLRRFPIPVLDSIMPVGTGKIRHKEGKNVGSIPIGTMVTWMGVSGNDMKNILKYSYKMSFEEKNAQWEDIEKQGGDNGLLNGLEAAANPATRKQWQGGNSVPALDNFMGSFFNAGQSPYPQMNTGSMVQRDKTKVYGPIDRVKKAFARGSSGLDWDQQFNLVFEYELKAYNGINPRQAMLDLLASILSVTYTTGGFWGGGYRGGGTRQSSFFSNLEIFKCHGTFTDFMDAVSKDVRSGINAIRQDMQGMNFIEYAKKMLNMIGGMLMGGMLNKLGRPARYFANSLISDAPVGLWHITIGNPHHPIMMMGNMILTNTEIEHSGPLGLDDFPTNLKVTCSFNRGKPRDQYGIENLYMQGNDRIFHSMQDKIADMYEAAQGYKSDPENYVPMKSGVDVWGNPNTDINNSTVQKNDASLEGSKDPTQPAVEVTGQNPQDPTEEQKLEAQQLTSLAHQQEISQSLLYWFGMNDADVATSMVIAAGEAGKGAFKAAPVEQGDPVSSSDGTGAGESDSERSSAAASDKPNS